MVFFLFIKKNMNENFFLSDEERGIDPTTGMANDCSRFQNAPRRDKQGRLMIPAWWLEEGEPEQITKWREMIANDEAVLE